MPKIKNIIGKKFERLTVLSLIGIDRHHSSLWKCQCACGAIAAVTRNSLIQGLVKSCGCLRDEKFKVNRKRGEPGEAAFNKLFRRYQRRSSEKRIAFHLSKEVFKKLTSMSCDYCGNAPSLEAKDRGNNGAYIYNTLDRAENSKGYTEDNTVPACWTCNRMKNVMNSFNFIKACEAVVKHRR